MASFAALNAVNFLQPFVPGPRESAQTGFQHVFLKKWLCYTVLSHAHNEAHTILAIICHCWMQFINQAKSFTLHSTAELGTFVQALSITQAQLWVSLTNELTNRYYANEISHCPDRHMLKRLWFIYKCTDSLVKAFTFHFMHEFYKTPALSVVNKFSNLYLQKCLDTLCGPLINYPRDLSVSFCKR